MELEQKAVEEMKRNPCLFRDRHYNECQDEVFYRCTLTATRIPGHSSQYEKCCDPKRCPMWKTYVMQLEAYKGD